MGHPRKSQILVMTKMDRQKVRQIFEGIRRASGREASYAPHKPLLLLMALSRVQRGLPRLFSFAEIEPELKKLLTEFGPSNAPSSRNMPFWFLRNDQKGQLWTLQLPETLVNHSLTEAPGVTALRQPGVLGGFSAEIDAALRADPGLVVELARQLLEKSFPESLHEDISAAVGLDLTPSFIQARDSDPGLYPAPRARRDKTFRDRVLRAYEYRCCICGFDLRLGHLPAGLEAAHIQWHNVGGPDVEPNGLSLCALHHKLFDLGAFTLEPSSLKVVFSEHALSGSRGMSGELRFHGQDLLKPVQEADLPANQFLVWNWRNVFKKEARKLHP